MKRFAYLVLALLIVLTVVSAQSPSVCCTDVLVLRKGVRSAYVALENDDVPLARKILRQAYEATDRGEE